MKVVIRCYRRTEKPVQFAMTSPPPLVELFVKSSSVDPGDKGACPFSQKWFMVFYLLVDRRRLNLRVIPVSMANPPLEYTRLDTGRRLPAIAYYSTHKDGQTSGNPDFVRAGNDELEEFIKTNFASELNVDAAEQWVGADLLRNLNYLLRTGYSQQLVANLVAINDYLLKANHVFIEGDSLSYSDCVLVCKLHHIRVAGAFYRYFNIPDELKQLWKYLQTVYATKAFDVTCPLDRDILLHYLDKVEFKNAEARNQVHHQIIFLPHGQRTTFLTSDLNESLSENSNLHSSGMKLIVNCVMPSAEYDGLVRDRLSRLYNDTD
ncbi:unnamed protein product [Mesocestoides corti]|uniref:GST C-terminal domain-containing protein n=1 Tax=Mesocestoides corti TaxID=53468 RepID=A0A0R3U2E6_MESCO|nr:unnamed protein product [Mesocestoides corti]